MTKNIEVTTNESAVTVECDDGTLRWDKVNDVISLDSSLSYATFIKMVKALKRSRNRESLSAEIDLGDD
jgi:hypothetical protein